MGDPVLLPQKSANSSSVRVGARFATTAFRMDAERSTEDILVRMLFDILSEADAIRWYDPARAAYLDEAANDLRAVLAETDANITDGSRHAVRRAH